MLNNSVGVSCACAKRVLPTRAVLVICGMCAESEKSGTWRSMLEKVRFCSPYRPIKEVDLATLPMNNVCNNVVTYVVVCNSIATSHCNSALSEHISGLGIVD